MGKMGQVCKLLIGKSNVRARFPLLHIVFKSPLEKAPAGVNFWLRILLRMDLGFENFWMRKMGHVCKLLDEKFQPAPKPRQDGFPQKKPDAPAEKFRANAIG